jgi:hypothetical protein
MYKTIKYILLRRDKKTMRRKLLLALCFAALCLSGAPASADLYELDAVTARLFRELAVTDAGNLALVIDSDGTFGSTVSYSDGSLAFDMYGATMQGAVGYVGQLAEDPTDGDILASILIGASGAAVGIVGEYDGYSALVANDNDDDWSFRLAAGIGPGTIYSNWATLSPRNSTTLTMNFAKIDFSTKLNWIGFEVQGTFDGANESPSNPDFFHVSITPVPGSILLGMLGLGVAGLKLRKFA